MSGPNGDPDVSIDDGIIEDGDDFEDEEYMAINSMLDQINNYLDGLEERNDALNGKLHELLESNRQARLEFRAQLVGNAAQEGGEQQQQRPEDAEDSSSPGSEKTGGSDTPAEGS